MKKPLLILMLLLVCVGCQSKKADINYTYDIVCKDVDMSGYEGVGSTQHMFKGITVDQLFNCIDKKSSGIFYLGRTNCGCCQTCCRYLNEAATRLNVNVYYIDVYDKDMPLTTDEICDKLRLYLNDILDVVDGKKELQTPTVFTVINGEFADHMICMNNQSWSTPPTEKEINKLIDRYVEMLKPFSN